jgi:hypothetical protein
MLQPEQGLPYYMICWKTKHVTNPFPHHTRQKEIPAFCIDPSPQLDSMSQGSNALNHKPRRMAASSKHPGKQGDMVNPQFS